MKKLLSTVAVLSALASAAQAQDINVQPYAGFDLQRTNHDYNGN